MKYDQLEGKWVKSGTKQWFFPIYYQKHDKNGYYYHTIVIIQTSSGLEASHGDWVLSGGNLRTFMPPSEMVHLAVRTIFGEKT
jgi:hypothetical protein